MTNSNRCPFSLLLLVMKLEKVTTKAYKNDLLPFVLQQNSSASSSVLTSINRVYVMGYPEKMIMVNRECYWVIYIIYIREREKERSGFWKNGVAMSLLW